MVEDFSAFEGNFLSNFKQLKADCLEFNLGEPKILTKLKHDLVVRIETTILFHNLEKEITYFVEVPTSDLSNMSGALSWLCESVSKDIDSRCRNS